MKLRALGETIDSAAYGGKAAHLSLAFAAGLPVPRGFVLSPGGVQHVASERASAPERALLEARLHDVGLPVAVRSSAVGEDGSTASFAGQHVSVLNLPDLDATLIAIRSVWSSGQSASAHAYRQRMRIAGQPQLAAIVQALVPSDVAGVLFTADPISGSDGRFVVEATWGFGEAVVAGLVTPDHYVVTRVGTVVERLIGQKDVAIRAMTSGGTGETEVHALQQNAACLDDEALSRLVALGLECERIFGPRQDIEWALAKGRLYLLQCRPVTARRVAPGELLVGGPSHEQELA
jgi:pyruvate,water dikinase